MPTPEMLTTTVSTNGQIILPRSVHRALLWDAGTRLVVEFAPEGVMLRQAPVFFETRSGDVFGCLAFCWAVQASGGDGSRRGFLRQRNGVSRAIDSNVVVRNLTGDDPRQAFRAGAVIDAGDVFASKTVLLESMRVLRSVYELG